jgi:cell division protein FtsL
MAEQPNFQGTSKRPRRHHPDSAERYKQQVMKSKKRRKIFGNVLFIALCVLAVAIVAFAYYIYTHD